ncbi:protein of unknown function DUF302 [Nitratifractor salsuginis DSM 16511]|uniref:DUF302 domain-containing protein n=2 Tax=Nitratifractor salsuginis TaxID=269261 RepID=E6X054_NITSE|nr:protein of unknown function DUF302 [Nitratifractor salsuginis DSM 16511]
MKNASLLTAVLLALFAISGCSGGKDRGAFLKEHTSDYNITESAKRITQALAPMNYHLLRTIDHEARAKALKFYLKPTLTLELDNPKISAKLLDCNPTMAVDLPLRIGFYNELNGTTHLVYTNPEYWSLKHNIKDKTCIQLINLLARDLDSASDAIKKSAK